MGFRVDYPCDFEITHLQHGPCTENPSRLCDSVLFQATDLYGNPFGLTVLRYWPAIGQTITDTVEYSLRNLASSSRDQIETRCCLTVSGERAMELRYPASPLDGAMNRHLAVVHSGGEYWLVFWWGVSFQPEAVTDLPPRSVAQEALETFISTFAFISITEIPTPPSPLSTAVPTPTGTPTALSGS
jgi:hypothetical protein